MAETKELPAEVLFFNILPRLPAKSIPRVMCVCKQWKLFLSTPLFSQMHLHHVTNDEHQNHHKHLIFFTKESHSFRTIDCETPKDSLTASRAFPFNATYYSMEILTSLHGLLCVGFPKPGGFHSLDRYSDLILWNPLTGDNKTLSKAGSDRNCYNFDVGPFGLYYISSQDDYKLLRVSLRSLAYIYSLKYDSWRKVESREDFFLSRLSSHVLLNEKLYFFKQPGQAVFATSISTSIVRFDTMTESFTKMETPSFVNHRRKRLLCFMVLRGCIHLCVSLSQKTIELWKMEEDGDWTKVVTYQPQSKLLSLFLNYQILHMMKNGNWLIHKILGRRISQLDLKKQPEEMKDMVVLSESISIPEIGKYIETMVSPNQYIK